MPRAFEVCETKGESESHTFPFRTPKARIFDSFSQHRLKRICTENQRADMRVHHLLQDCVNNPKMETILRIMPRAFKVYGNNGQDHALQIRPPEALLGSFSRHRLKPIWTGNQRADMTLYDLLKVCVPNPKIETIFRITSHTLEVYGSNGDNPAFQIRPPKA
jgi:hypothetical protein